MAPSRQASRFIISAEISDAVMSSTWSLLEFQNIRLFIRHRRNVKNAEKKTGTNVRMAVVNVVPVEKHGDGSAITAMLLIVPSTSG